ncbi:UPF0587 protein v1g245604-like [Xenia sp. Carnegie-2017]|uniref:UPF0587 protein v1g245604-like n=1 Tax=Xenia sp. Carnegie-2017 TaxID=2897299 RepID=UPI001F0437EE|nr:UPF0587 protein v1g245604-like [Xenia sp. Carnegie-2017]
MVKIGLQFKCSLENVTDVQPEEDDFRWYLKVKCLNCGEENPNWIYATLQECQPIKGGRGQANFVSHCKLCGRHNSLDILKDSIKPYKADDDNKYKTIVSFDCRGLEPTDFSPRVGFSAKGLETETKFNDIDLTEKEWADYDEQAQESVGIYEVTHKFVKL